MKQTAVEWFEDQVGHNSLMGLKEFNEIFEQAKEMEKEQIVNAYNDCEWTGDHEDGEQYYNETFNKSINNKG
jgi:hypothetical protein